jgi:hypothetical protein
MRPNMSRVVVGLCALATVLVPMVGRSDARASSSRALVVEQFPVQRADPGTATWLFVADGGVWSLSGDDVHRIDLWVAAARHAAQTGDFDGRLTRVTKAGRISIVPRVRPWSVASGDGFTWFVGTTHRVAKTTTPEPVARVLGRVDTGTGKHLRTYHLDVAGQSIGDAHQVTLLAATGGSVRLSVGQGSGTLVRVTERTR